MSGPQEEKTQGDASETPAANDATEGKESLPSLEGEGVLMRYSGRTAVGLVREHNEDNFIISDLSSGDVRPREALCADTVATGGMLFAVCDGMGGAAAGEVASQMAVDILHEAMRRGGAPKDRDQLARRLVSAVEEAGKRIFDGAQKERSRRGMGTTATVAVLADKVLFLAEVGDSRAYLLRRGELKQLTKDQSLVNQLIEAGHLTEAEAEAFEHSNIILQALGTSETVQVDLTFVELRKGDRLMMCSDGLSGLVHADTLRDALAAIDNPDECAATLIKYAEAGGGHDNITVIVVDFGGDALDSSRETDSFGYMQYPLLPEGAASELVPDEKTSESAVNASLRTTFPPAPPVDRSSWLWVSAGIVTLVVGAWILAVSSSNGSATADPALPALEEAKALAPAPQAVAAAAEEPEIKPVSVQVWSDIEDAVLLVNGEARGRLALGESSTMDLRPGAYRFEAQSHGNIAAVEVVTVRPDVPLTVRLRLPSGTTEPKSGTPESTKPAEPVENEASAHGEAASADPVKVVKAARKPRVASPAVEEGTREPETSSSQAAGAGEPPAQPPAPPPVQQQPSPEPAPAPKPSDIPDNPF